ARTYTKGRGRQRQPRPARASEPVAGACGVPATVAPHVQQHVVEATMRALGFVRDVQDLREERETLEDVVARGQVDLRAGIDERRLGTECTGVLNLAELEQVLIAPVERGTKLQPLLVVEGDEVRRICETGDGKAALRDVVGVVRLVRIDECRVGNEA